MTGLLLQIIIVIPTTFAGSLIYSHTFMICVCSLDYITYNLSSYFTFLILIEIVVVSFVGASYATGYYTNFSATEYHFVQESEDGNVLKTIVNVTAYYVPFVMIAIYLFIFAFLQFSQNLCQSLIANKISSANTVTYKRGLLLKKRELTFLFQSCLISVMFLVEHFFFVAMHDTLFLKQLLSKKLKKTFFTLSDCIKPKNYSRELKSGTITFNYGPINGSRKQFNQIPGLNLISEAEDKRIEDYCLEVKTRPFTQYDIVVAKASIGEMMCQGTLFTSWHVYLTIACMEKAMLKKFIFLVEGKCYKIGEGCPAMDMIDLKHIKYVFEVTCCLVWCNSMKRLLLISIPYVLGTLNGKCRRTTVSAGPMKMAEEQMLVFTSPQEHLQSTEPICKIKRFCAQNKDTTKKLGPFDLGGPVMSPAKISPPEGIVFRGLFIKQISVEGAETNVFLRDAFISQSLCTLTNRCAFLSSPARQRLQNPLKEMKIFNVMVDGGSSKNRRLNEFFEQSIGQDNGQSAGGQCEITDAAKTEEEVGCANGEELKEGQEAARVQEPEEVQK
uniref:Uncharacterized protein n=1 Tax=Ditylenchus dipsaci TaxID=166011 RepID=A0A915E337_9BILA